MLNRECKVVVVGLGYVGLPLAVRLAETFHTVGFDIDRERVTELRRGFDRTNEIPSARLSESTLKLTWDEEEAHDAEIYIVTVPTPVDHLNRPDLGPVIKATETVARLLRPGHGSIVVYESTVYPGVTEDICGPLLASISGLERGEDFFLGYSPERINPGDREHTVERITKVVAGENAEITERLAMIYDNVTSGGVFRSASIRAAEAAKVIENAQRDINIAFMNEIARIFNKIDLSIWDVLAAASTKWNFLPFKPGLVGGHCIGVDPYYLSHLAKEVGQEPNVVLAGRTINDSMGEWVADALHTRSGGRGRKALILGLTFKENVPDLRNSKVIDVVSRLKWLGYEVAIHDPLADPIQAEREFGIQLLPDTLESRYDIVLGAVAHDAYITMSSDELVNLLLPNGVLGDLKAMWRDRVFPGVERWSL